MAALLRSGPLPPVFVTLSLGSCGTLLKGDEAATATRIYEFLVQRASSFTGEVQSYHLHELAVVSPELLRLDVSTGVRRSVVGQHSACVVDESWLAAIEEAVREKEAGLARYRAQYDECWLLLGVNGQDPAEWIEPGAYACETGVQSGFDRILVVDPLTSVRCPVAELRPKPPLARITPDA